MRLEIATPCHEDWSAMTPTGPGRHCASCDKTVLDLTALTPGQSLAALAAVRTRVDAGEKLCVRAHADARGRLRTTRARRRLLTNGLAAMLAVAVAGGIGGCAPGDVGGGAQAERQPPALHGDATVAPRPVDPPRPLMGAPKPHPVVGKVAAPPQPAPRMGEASARPLSREGATAPIGPTAVATGGSAMASHQDPEPEASLMGDVSMPSPPQAEPARAPDIATEAARAQ